MTDKKVYRSLGLMSGTSLDGIDAALIETDGQGYVKPLGFKTVEYDPALRIALRAALGHENRDDPVVKTAEAAMTNAHIDLVRQFDLGAIDLIGFHGQTIYHAPHKRLTIQIGDAAAMARQTGVDVVADFRSADVAAGGQGAPFLPLYHQARVRAQNLDMPVAIVNIGGVANVTWIGPEDDHLIAFDTGPGNALIDDWVQSRAGMACDKNGIWADQGNLEESQSAPFNEWRHDPYFRKHPPKSLDRDHWSIKGLDHLALEDGAACLTDFTVWCIHEAMRHFPRNLGLFPKNPHHWYIAGGGRKNLTLMQWLQEALHAPVETVEALGWNGDALEAEGFAYLAVRSLLGLPLSMPQTTGVPTPQTGGVLFGP